MRNLKKILALVLALVMSLSLMATAGAKDFGDSDQVNANYKTAIDVLSELKVFGGYDDGTFKPQQNITRAEVAAIIYRIATGDVMGDKVALYSDMTNSKLADLNQAEWARGQINYCYNAGIIKGVNNTDFEPNANVTGYAALTMILRALGYGQNGEFVGDQWEMNTASRARELGLLDKISEGQLGAPATREMVAEILFRTMLKETVTWTALQGYQTTGTTLGYQTFKLRDVTGVVTANKWANLYGSSVLSDGQTNVILNGEENSTRIAIDTELTDIGEARRFYITGTVGAKNATFIAYDQEGVTNNTYSNAGAATDISTSSKFGSVTGMSKDADTEQFVNFEKGTIGKSEYRLEYSITFDNNKKFDGQTSQEWFADKYGVDPDDVIAVNGNTRLDTETLDTTEGKNEKTYTRVIPRGDDITTDDVAIMEGIFSVADNDGSKSAGVDGYVFAGTNSQSNVNRNLDLSDELGWNEFYDTYINSKNNTVVNSVVNGEWLKVVDNDNDGVAEYVFKTEFWMDKAIGSHTSKGETVLEYNTLSETSKAYDVRYIDEINVGDVVVYSNIDGKANVCLADVLTDEVVKVNYKTTEIETAGGETKGQSRIYNETELDDDITLMDQTEYNMYLDEFGYVRAYELPGGTDYALVTEAYFGNRANGAFVNNETVTVEIGIGEEQAQERVLTNWSRRNGNDLVAGTYYSLFTPTYNQLQFQNYLQPAVAHLGTDYADKRVPTTLTGASALRYTSGGRVIWAWENQSTNKITAMGNCAAFNYETGANDIDNYSDSDDYVSMTNIGIYSGLTDDEVTLTGAAKLAYEKSSRDELYRIIGGTALFGDFKANQKVTQAEWEDAYSALPAHAGLNARAAFNNALADYELVRVYATDYIQLDHTQSIAKGERHYDIADVDLDLTGVLDGTAADPASYKALNNNYVNAIHTTQYYIVDGSGHTYFTDYANVPAISADNILAAYAVAKDTNSDTDGEPYWVADVIVIEVKSYSDVKFHSIALAYFESEKNAGRVHSVETLNNEWENNDYDTEVTMIPGTTNWFANWNGQAFYKLYNAEMDGDELAVGATQLITQGDYNRNGIYTGTILRLKSTLEGGDYIDVQLDNITPTKGDAVAISKAPVYVVSRNDAGQVTLSSSDNSSDVRKGDQVIIVTNNDKTKTSFIIDVSLDPTDYLSFGKNVPSWLQDIVTDIAEEQGWTGGDPDSVDRLISAAQRLTDGITVPTLKQLEMSKALLEDAIKNNHDMSAKQVEAIVGNGTIAADGTVSGNTSGLLYDLAGAITTGDSSALAALKAKATAVAEGMVPAAVADDTDVIDALKALIGSTEDGDEADGIITAATAATIGDIYDEKTNTLDPTLDEVIDLQDAIAQAQARVKLANDITAAVEAKLAADTTLDNYPTTKGKLDTLLDAVADLEKNDSKDDFAAYYNTDGTLKTTKDDVKEVLDAMDAETPKSDEEIAADAANEAIAAAKEKIEAVGTWDDVTIKSADKPTVAAVKAEIQKLVNAALTEGQAAGGTTASATATVNVASDALDSLTVTTEAAISFTVDVEATGGEKQTVADQSVDLTWYWNSTKITTTVASAVGAIADKTAANYSDEDAVVAALKTAVAKDITGISDTDVTVTITSTNKNGVGKVEFTYSFTYGGDTIEGSGDITLE